MPPRRSSPRRSTASTTADRHAGTSPARTRRSTRSDDRQRELVPRRPQQLGAAHRHARRDELEQLRAAVGERGDGRRLGAVAADEPLRGGDGPQRGGRRGADQRQARRAARAVGDPVDDVLGHAAVRGELAADDGERAARVLGDQVAAREVGGLAVAGGQRPQAGVAAADVAGAERGGERGRGAVEQLGLLGRVRLRLVGGLAGDVGEADRHESVRARQREDPAAVLAGDGDVDRRPRLAQPRGRHEQVRAAARAQRHRGQRVRPDAGGHDRVARPHREAGAGQRVDGLDAVLAQPGDLGVGERSARRGRPPCGPRRPPAARRPRAGRPSSAARRAGRPGAGPERAGAPPERSPAAAAAAARRLVRAPTRRPSPTRRPIVVFRAVLLPMASSSGIRNGSGRARCGAIVRMSVARSTAHSQARPHSPCCR